MIFVNPDLLHIPAARQARMDALTKALLDEPSVHRSQFIDDNRSETWGHAEVLNALRAIVGNKCWYSEVHLEGADPNIDHFRPKGRVREVDDDFKNLGIISVGYWWLAFELSNYRLASMHSNQRRVDDDSEGGKSDYFPIKGDRAPEKTRWEDIIEDTLVLDPCLKTDVKLLWFDPDGNPGAAKIKDQDSDERDILRVKATIWMYHLDKKEIQVRRSGHVQDIRKDLKKADTEYRLWARGSANPNLQAKKGFDRKVAEIIRKIADDAEFAGAKRCAIRSASAEYHWIEEFNIV